MNTACFAACENNFWLTWNGMKILRRSAASSSCPMLAHTSVYTASAPATASHGSFVTCTFAPVVAASFSAAARDARVRFVTCRSRHRYRGAQARCSQHQRVCNVVAVSHIGETYIVQIAELFLQCLHVGHRLARVLQLAQRIDHRNGCEWRAISVTVSCEKVRSTTPSIQRSRLWATSLRLSRAPSRDCV